MGLDAVINTGGSTAGKANVDANFNLEVVTPQTIAQAGTVVDGVQNGDTTYAATAYRKTLRGSAQDRLFVGIDTPLFDYPFTATSQDTGVWKFAATTQTMAQSGGTAQFNTGNSGTSTTGSYIQTWRQFILSANGGLRVGFNGFISGVPPANQVIELGLFLGTITAAPADGVYFRITSAGISGVLNFNGVETAVVFNIAAYDTYFGVANVASDLWFNVYNDTVDFYVSDLYLGSIPVPNGNGFPFLSAGLPVCAQQRNSGTVTTPTNYKLSHVRVGQLDIDLGLPFPHVQAGMGLTSSQAVQGQTAGTTAAYPNSSAPGTGVAMSNTSAAIGSGLGGQFAVLPTLATNTDGIICSYQVPAGATTEPPRTFMCTGVRVQGGVTTALVGGNVQYFYSLAYGHTAVSMATAEGGSYTTSPTTKAPRRIAIGQENFAAAAAVGTIGSVDGQKMQFLSPIPVNPGEFIAVCAKNVGTVTSAGVITFLVTFDGYWN